MRRFLTSLFSRRPVRAKANPTRPAWLRARPTLETLGERIVPAALISPNGTVSIGGTPGRDVATVSALPGTIRVTLSENGGPNRTYNFEALKVKVIIFSGGDGNDTCFNNTNVPSFLYGDNGDDYLVGGGGRDSLFGGGQYGEGYGNDTIFGGAGDDLLYGFEGNDVLVGLAGNDTLAGGNGNDTLFGNEGNDALFGDAGNDVLVGGTDNDNLYGGVGNDALFGETGFDRLFGDAGDDYLDGGKDGIADGLYGGTGKDTFVREYVSYSTARNDHNLDGSTDFSTYDHDVFV